jgi:hypothetical protein
VRIAWAYMEQGFLPTDGSSIYHTHVKIFEVPGNKGCDAANV